MKADISVAISILALVISLLQLFFYRKDEKVHRKNDIKPILKCESVQCFSEGYVPNSRWSLEMENGIYVPIYLIINNIGVGSTIKYIINISIENELCHRILVPSVIKSDEREQLLIVLENVDKEYLLKKRLYLDLKYYDLDGNQYITKLSGVFLMMGEELFYRITDEDMDYKFRNIDCCDEVAKYTGSEW